MSPRHPENLQRAALANVGCAAIYVDGPDNIRDFMAEMRKGDTVVVTTLARLSSNRRDLKTILSFVHASKGHVWELSTDRRSNVAANAAEMVLDAISEQTGDAKATPHAEAVRRGSKGGKAKKKNAAKARTPKAVAKGVWYDPNIKGVRNKLAQPEMEGWSQASAYRLIGKSR